MGLETHELSSSKLVNPEFLSTAKTGKKLVERRLTISRKNSWSNATMHRSVYERFDMDLTTTPWRNIGPSRWPTT